MEHRTNAGTNAYTKAIEAFRLRQLTFTLQWRRFPWTYGVDPDQALVGPEYLGSVMIGLKDSWSWGYQDRAGCWKYVQLDRLDLLVNSVLQDRAGYSQPPLPRRSEWRAQRRK